MMLKSRMEDDLKTGLKSNDKAAVATLRLLLSAIKNEELKTGKAIDDAGVIAVLSTQLKQRHESIDAFEKGGRNELAEKEKNEIEIIRRYLPKPLSDDELAELVDEAITESNAQSPKDMGKVMKIVMPKVQGRADGKAVSDLVKQKLAATS